LFERGCSALRVQIMKKYRLFVPAVFLFMLFYFTVLHPIPIMDGDDMVYIMHFRPAIPIPFSWNPSRVLPEVLMPLCGNLAGIMAAAGIGSFMNCQVFSLALFLSFFIAFYVGCCVNLMEKRMGLGRFPAVCLSILFLMLHFTIFRTQDSYNLHLFKSYDACCIFFYTIPTLLSCSLAMLFFSVDEPSDLILKGSMVKRAAVVTAIYFSVFSNLFGSVIFPAYMGCRLLFNLIKDIKSKFEFKSFLQKNYVYIAVVLLWLLAVAFEALGGRAGSLGSSGNGMSFAAKAAQSSANLFSAFSRTSLLFKLILGFSVIGAVAVLLFFRKKGERSAELFVLTTTFSCCLISAVFLILLCAATGPAYMTRPDVHCTVFSPLILIMVLCIGIILRKFAFLELFLPIALIFTFSMTNTELQTFADVNPISADGNVALAIQNDICEQIISGAESGADEITVYVLQSDDYAANWPHNSGIGNSFADFFLKFGLIDHPVDVTVIPSTEFNEKYNVSFDWAY